MNAIATLKSVLDAVFKIEEAVAPKEKAAQIQQVHKAFDAAFANMQPAMSSTAPLATGCSPSSSQELDSLDDAYNSASNPVPSTTAGSQNSASMSAATAPGQTGLGAAVPSTTVGSQNSRSISAATAPGQTGLGAAVSSTTVGSQNSASMSAGRSPGQTTTGSANFASGSGGSPRITMGGLEGLGNLADPNASAKFRAGGGGLYIHAMGWANLSDAQKNAIGANFRGTGGADVETSANDNLRDNYLSHGIDKVSDVSLNSPTDTVGAGELAAWQGDVNNWKGQNVGLNDAAYDLTPNGPGGPPKPFSDPMWDSIRQAAIKGGGVILDVPPTMYTSVMGDNYRQFIQDEVKWANDNGLHSTVILSGMKGDALPSGSDPGAFAKNTHAMVAAFNALPPDQRPQQYALENYGAGVGVGTEDQPGTIANVALWCLNNASTYNPKG